MKIKSDYIIKILKKIILEKHTYTVITSLGAIGAVVVGSSQLSSFIEYNKLSSRPIVAIEYDQDKYTSSLKATNMGQVAILHGIHVKNERSGEYFQDWRSISNFISGSENNFRQCGDIVESYPMSENKVKILLSSYGHSINKKMPISVSMCYCSLYEECWTTHFLQREKNLSGEKSITTGKIVKVSNCDFFKSEAPSVYCNANE